MIQSISLSLPSNSSTISSTKFPSQFPMHFYFYNSLNLPRAGLYVLGCRTIFWSIGGLLASFLKKTYPPSQAAINRQWFFSKGWDFMNIFWHFVWFALVQVIIHADTSILSSCVQWSCLLQRSLPCCRLPLPLALTVFPFSLLLMVPETWEEWCDVTGLFRAEHTTASCSTRCLYCQGVQSSLY